jgi:hypothetical protein
MNPEHVVAVAVRLFAIGLTVYVVTGAVGTAPVYFTRKFEPSVFLLVVGGTFLTLVAALLLWRFPLWIASKLLPYDHSRSGGSSSVTGGELQTVAFTVLGIYFMFKAVVAAVYWVFWFSSVRSMGFDPAADQWASVLKTLAELVLACFLVFGARGLTGLIRKVRGPEIS